MARVGLLGKPVVLRVGVQATVAEAAAAAVSRVVAGCGLGSGEGGKGAEGAPAAPPPPPTVSLPAGLRLGRLTCTKDSKDAALCYLLLRYPGKTLIFVNAISTLRRVVAFLTALRLPVTSLHAHMQQRQRFSHLDRFRADPAGVLVATDVAARGLDIPAVGTVINYSLPHSSESFVHRCGRTARAASAGLALSLVGPEDTQPYIKLLGVLGMPEGLPEFPVDAPFLRKLHHRASLARRVADLTLAVDKESAQGYWLASTAKAAGWRCKPRLRRRTGAWTKTKTETRQAVGEGRRGLPSAASSTTATAVVVGTWRAKTAPRLKLPGCAPSARNWPACEPS